MLSGSVAICCQPAGGRSGGGAGLAGPLGRGLLPHGGGSARAATRGTGCTEFKLARPSALGGGRLFGGRQTEPACSRSRRDAAAALAARGVYLYPLKNMCPSPFPHPVFELTRSASEMLLHGAGAARSALEAAAGTASALACATTGTTTVSSASSWQPSARLRACASRPTLPGAQAAVAAARDAQREALTMSKSNLKDISGGSRGAVNTLLCCGHCMRCSVFDTAMRDARCSRPGSRMTANSQLLATDRLHRSCVRLLFIFRPLFCFRPRFHDLFMLGGNSPAQASPRRRRRRRHHPQQHAA